MVEKSHDGVAANRRQFLYIVGRLGGAVNIADAGGKAEDRDAAENGLVGVVDNLEGDVRRDVVHHGLGVRDAPEIAVQAAIRIKTVAKILGTEFWRFFFRALPNFGGRVHDAAAPLPPSSCVVLMVIHPIS